LIAAFIFSGLACSTVRPTTLAVPLIWKPKGSQSGAVSSTNQMKICVLPVTDKRANADAIGENHEKAGMPVPILASGQSPAEFVHQGMMDELRRAGFNVVDTPDTADRLVAINLNTFWAMEDQTYNAQVSIGVGVRDKTGKVLWSGNTTGEADNWGKSLNPENYQESFSDAVAKAATDLMAVPGFQQALSGAPAAAAQPIAAPTLP
jgi:hypothetical protein